MQASFPEGSPSVQSCPGRAGTGYPECFLYCLPSTAFHSGLVLAGWGVCLTTETTWWLWMTCSPRVWRRLTSSSAGPRGRRWAWLTLTQVFQAKWESNFLFCISRCSIQTSLLWSRCGMNNSSIKYFLSITLMWCLIFLTCVRMQGQHCRVWRRVWAAPRDVTGQPETRVTWDFFFSCFFLVFWVLYGFFVWLIGIFFCLMHINCKFWEINHCLQWMGGCS